LARITKVTIESRHKCLTISGKEEGRYGCDVGGEEESHYAMECWNSGLDGWLEAMEASIHLEAVTGSYMQVEVMVATTSKAAGLREALPIASRVLDPYENPIN
jgi:hypothetical protein